MKTEREDIERIRKNAPKGATHYHKTSFGAIYLRKVPSFIFFTKWESYNESLLIWSDAIIAKYYKIKPL